MSGLLRRRAMALAMLILAPGITGRVVQSLHACPAQASAAADHRDHSQAPTHGGHPQSCECIGFCNTAGTAPPANPVVVTAPIIRPGHHLVQSSGISFVAAGTPSDLLPPATAPPFLS